MGSLAISKSSMLLVRDTQFKNVYPTKDARPIGLKSKIINYLQSKMASPFFMDCSGMSEKEHAGCFSHLCGQSLQILCVLSQLLCGQIIFIRNYA